MKTITFTLALFISFISFAENNGYTEAMEDALNQYQTAKTVADYQSTANTFQRISGMANEEWLPKYYHAQCYILMSFMDRKADAATKDAYIDQAETSINSMIEIQPENSEVYALQSFMNTARLVIDPMTRGQEFSIKSATSVKKSLSFNPTNPRALYLQLSNEVGAAQFFGKDVSIYCDRINALLENWDEFNKSEPMHPQWGKNQVIGMAANCTPKSDTTTVNN